METKPDTTDYSLNMLGIYGGWAREINNGNPRPLSFLNHRWGDAEQWRKTARAEVLRLLAPPATLPVDIKNVRVTGRHRYDGLDIEELSWQLPFGPPTGALFLKPEGARGPLPGVLAMHDHGGIKYFGKRKITRTAGFRHPLMREHQELYYGGEPLANGLAKRGYGVLVHDVFPFESRKISASGLPAYAVRRMMSPPLTVEELTPADVKPGAAITDYDVPDGDGIPEGSASAGVPENRIKAYDAFAAQHEHIIAKALFSLGHTWPGVVLAEDTLALDYLCSRPDIDMERIGCCGLSGGGLRTNYLAGLDDRVSCSVTAGFMTTWNDLALNTCYTHTWMIYIPGLAGLMDFPDILAMRTPLPALVLATDEDPLFTGTETTAAAATLQGAYKKSGVSDAFRFSLHKGPHKFDGPMQAEAFAWFDRWLKSK